METPITALPEEKKRPTFLSVLCTLTFIGAGLMLLFSLFSIQETFFTTTQEKIERMEKAYEPMENSMPGITEKMIDFVIENDKHAVPNFLLNFFGQILSLVGAILMWKLRKSGFWLYAAAEILPSVISFAFLNGMKAMTGMLSAFGPMVENIGMVFIVIILILDFAFIVMYAANVKYMK